MLDVPAGGDSVEKASAPEVAAAVAQDEVVVSEDAVADAAKAADEAAAS